MNSENAFADHGSRPDIIIHPSSHTDIDHIDHAINMDDYVVIFQGSIGVGNYGTVSRGQLEYKCDGTIQEVAIKTLRPMQDRNAMKDFIREIDIMKVCRLLIELKVIMVLIFIFVLFNRDLIIGIL